MIQSTFQKTTIFLALSSLLAMGPAYGNTINKNDTYTWKANDQLSDIHFSGTVNDSLMLKTAISHLDSEFRRGIAGNISTSITGLKGVVAGEAGRNIGVLKFSESTELDGGNGATNQRLNIGDKAGIMNIDIGKTVVIKDNTLKLEGISSNTASALVVAKNGFLEVIGGGTLLIENNRTYRDGNVLIYGGAIFNQGTLIFGDNTALNENSVETKGRGTGGALENEETTLFGDNAIFTNNSVTTDAVAEGGAISNEKNLGIGNNASFVSNSVNATDYSSFLNTVSGGGIFSDGVVIIGNDVLFNGNKALSTALNAYGGAVYSGFNGELLIGNNARFINNIAQTNTDAATMKAIGGALYLEGGIFQLGSNSLFKDNKVISKNSDSTVKGGAIYAKEMELRFDSGNKGDSTLFTGNQMVQQNKIIANSLYFEGNNRLMISGDGDFEFKDPMLSEGGDAVTVDFIKKGTGSFQLGGISTFNSKANFDLQGGTFSFYEDNEIENSENGLVKSGSLILNGIGSSFKLADGMNVLLKGGDHTISANMGSIIFGNEVTLHLDLDRHSPDITQSMLTLESASIQFGNTLDIDLLTLGEKDTEYVVLETKKGESGYYDFSGMTYNTTYKGYDVNSIDRLSGSINVTDNAGKLIVENDIEFNNLEVVWTGRNSTDWTLGRDNWNNDMTQSGFMDGDAVLFNGKGSDTINIMKHGVAVAGMRMVGGDYTFTGGIISSIDPIDSTLTNSTGLTEALTVQNTAVRFNNQGLKFKNGINFGEGAQIAFGVKDQATVYNIVGDVTFGADSILLVDAVDSGANDSTISSNTAAHSTEADQLHVIGKTILEGGSVVVNSNNATWENDQHYTIISTTEGVEGTFDDDIESDLVFLETTLTYDDKNVYLHLTRNETEFHEIAKTQNQFNTSLGIASLSESSPVYKALVSLSQEAAIAAYDNLSGEIYGSTRSMLLLQSAHLREQIGRRLTNVSASDPMTVWGGRMGWC